MPQCKVSGFPGSGGIIMILDTMNGIDVQIHVIGELHELKFKEGDNGCALYLEEEQTRALLFAFALIKAERLKNSPKEEA